MCQEDLVPRVRRSVSLTELGEGENPTIPSRIHLTLSILFVFWCLRRQSSNTYPVTVQSKHCFTWMSDEKLQLSALLFSREPIVNNIAVFISVTALKPHSGESTESQ